MPDERVVLLSDANVLIDYRDANLSVLTLASAHIGRVRVLHEVLSEVRGFDVEMAQSLGIEVFEDLAGELFLEIDGLSRRLSRADRLCFLACREYGWTCLTNDRLLRKLCDDHGIPLRWGLEVMMDLCASGALSKEVAVRTAKSIQLTNQSITEDVLEQFVLKINLIVGDHEKT